MSLAIEGNKTTLAEENNTHSIALTLNETGEITALVSCSGNSSFEPINKTLVLKVVRNGAYLLKDSEYEGLRFKFWFIWEPDRDSSVLVNGHLGEIDSSRSSFSIRQDSLWMKTMVQLILHWLT